MKGLRRQIDKAIRILKYFTKKLHHILWIFSLCPLKMSYAISRTGKIDEILKTKHVIIVSYFSSTLIVLILSIFDNLFLYCKASYVSANIWSNEFLPESRFEITILPYLSITLFLLSFCLSIPPPLHLYICLSVCLFVGWLVRPSVCLPVGLSSICLSICLPIYLSIYLSTYLLIYLSICLPAYLSSSLSVCLSVFLSVRQSISLCMYVCMYVYPSVYLFICLSVYLSVCLSVCLFICLSVYLSVFLSFYLSIYVSVTRQTT